MSDDLTPEFELPSESARRRDDDSIALQGAYQRYWEVVEMERRQKARRRRRVSRGPYEEAWREYYGGAKR